jgi:hypothetical protein
LSKNPNRIGVDIVNPLPGMQAVTSLAHARRYVRSGRADIIAGKLVFRAADHRHQSAKRTATLRYDDGLASVQAVKNLPCAGDVVRVFMGRRATGAILQDRVIQISARTVMVSL